MTLNILYVSTVGANNDYNNKAGTDTRVKSNGFPSSSSQRESASVRYWNTNCGDNEGSHENLSNFFICTQGGGMQLAQGTILHATIAR